MLLRWLLWLFRLEIFAGPSIHVTFRPAGDPKMPAALIGTVTLGPAATNVVVASRSLTLALNGAAPGPLPTGTPITFTCNDGDAFVLTSQDTSLGGVLSVPTVLSGVAHDTVTAPTSATLVVSFAPAAS
jgi:hypothetical protein